MRAAGGEDWKDVSVLDQGTERHAVIAELGTPVLTEQDEIGSTVDVFAFKQGDIALERAGRSLFYGVAAVGTLGLSEILANPAEGMIGEGKEIQVRVTYDAEDRIDYTELLRMIAGPNSRRSANGRSPTKSTSEFWRPHSSCL